MWRGKLPHWRADDVTYYVTFRHRRALTEDERRLLLRSLLRAEGRRWVLQIVCVLPEQTEMLFSVCKTLSGHSYELADVVEASKRKTGNAIIKKTGERWSPFYEESFDRIVRDENELVERWQAIFESPVGQGLVEDEEEYEFLWVSEATDL